MWPKVHADWRRRLPHPALAMHASADLAVCCLQSAASSNAQKAAMHTGKMISELISSQLSYFY